MQYEIVSRPFGSAPAACEKCVFNRGQHSDWCPQKHWTAAANCDDDPDEDWLTVGRRFWADTEGRL